MRKSNRAKGRPRSRIQCRRGQERTMQAPQAESGKARKPKTVEYFVVSS